MLKQKEGRLVKYNKIFTLLRAKLTFFYKKLKKVMWVGTTGMIMKIFN